jgi:hypothetical protein
MIFNFIICFISLFLAIVPNWTNVPRKSLSQPEALNKEKGEWVVLMKALEHEKWVIQFPDDPVYHISADGIHFSAIDENGDAFSLQARKLSLEKGFLIPELEEGAFLVDLKQTPSVVDRSYRLGEKWVFERFFLSSHTFYTFRTESGFPLGNHHQKFVNSFEVLQKI